MADFTLSEILSKVASLTPPSVTQPGTAVMQTFNCPSVLAANTEFNNKFGVLMSYWEPFQMIIRNCRGNEDGSTPNSFNAKTADCLKQYPCSSVLGSTPRVNCNNEQIVNDSINHTDCWTTAQNQYQTCVSTGMNNNSLSYYKDRILEALDSTVTAYDKLQSAIRDCRRIKGSETTQAQ